MGCFFQVLIAEEAEAEAGVGELCISSPAMFKEYWRKPEVTKESFRDDGFFKTGDTVTIVDGYVKILGRESMVALESLCSILSVACLFIVVVLLHSQEVFAWFYISSQTCFATMCSYLAL
jgi:acyl-CoA synthetase (AMP-forming)/AMP-acid ligase II